MDRRYQRPEWIGCDLVSPNICSDNVGCESSTSDADGGSLDMLISEARRQE